MPQTDDYDQRQDLGWFRDELRQRDRLIAVKRWNRAVPAFNAGLQDVGRPLAASAAQLPRR